MSFPSIPMVMISNISLFIIKSAPNVVAVDVAAPIGVVEATAALRYDAVAQVHPPAHRTTCHKTHL